MSSEVSVRELRQYLSVFLRRVESGETLSVTRRGERVAILAPLPGRGSVLDRLVADGNATAPAGDLLDLGPPPAPEPGAPSLSGVVDELREERTPSATR